MKKYQIIGFTLWTLGNILLILRMWDYLLIAPILATQVIIWICCSILFCIDVTIKMFGGNAMEHYIKFLKMGCFSREDVTKITRNLNTAIKEHPVALWKMQNNTNR